MTRAYALCKERGYSVFLYYLHAALTAGNDLEPFKMRIIEGEPWVYDVVHASCTVLRPDETFGFSNIRFHRDFEAFQEGARQEIARVQADGRLFSFEADPYEFLHFSALPWIDFSSVSHARHFPAGDSIPKYSFGKIVEEGGRRSMHCSVHVHHSLVDGLHVGRYMEAFQRNLDQE